MTTTFNEEQMAVLKLLFHAASKSPDFAVKVWTEKPQLMDNALWLDLLSKLTIPIQIQQLVNKGQQRLEKGTLP